MSLFEGVEADEKDAPSEARSRQAEWMLLAHAPPTAYQRKHFTDSSSQTSNAVTRSIGRWEQSVSRSGRPRKRTVPPSEASATGTSSISISDPLVDEILDVTFDVRGFVEAAIELSLEQEGLRQLVAEIRAEVGPPEQEVLDEIEDFLDGFENGS